MLNAFVKISSWSEEKLPQPTLCLVRGLALHFLGGLIQAIIRLVQEWLLAHGRDFSPIWGEPVRGPLPQPVELNKEGRRGMPVPGWVHLPESMSVANALCLLS